MATRVTSYSRYKCLSPDRLEKSARATPSGLYEDDEFPCTPASIGAAASKHVTMWLRPSEIDPEAEFFVDGAEEGDVVQGALGDCWFLSALAVCAHREELIHNLVVTARPDLGFYQIRFWKELAWVTITIDDRLPCNAARRPVFATSDSGKEFWPSLFEKAYAKLHGTYGRLESGTVEYGMVDLTGGVADTPDWDSMVRDGVVWDRIGEVLDEAWLAGCAINGGTESDTGVGLLSGHAYSIIGLARAGGEDLIRLRNPWGQKEWNGRWSDDSAEMSPAVQKELGYTAADDGTFFMAKADFIKWFDRMYVCRLYQDDIGDVWRRNAIYGDWDARSAGGCVNHSTWRDNPQFSLVPSANTKAHISLIQADARMSPDEAYVPIGFCLLRSPSAVERATMAAQRHVVVSTTFTPGRYSTVEVELEKDQAYVLVGSTFDAGVHRNFVFLLNSEKKIQVLRLNPDGTHEEDDEDLIDLSVSSKRSAKPWHAMIKGKVFANKRSTPKHREKQSTKLKEKQSTKLKEKQSTKQKESYSSTTSSTGGVPNVHRTTTITTTTTTKSVGNPPDTVKPESLHHQSFSNGDSYFGQSNGDGERHGWGKYTFSNGTTYVGYYKNGKKHGHGTFTQGDITYEGEYVMGIKQGKGTLNSSIATYRGDFHHDKFHGNGTHVDIASKQRYSGGFREGRKHGLGTITWPSGASYSGEFANGTMKQGTYRYPSGDTYTGPFRDGRPHGKGVYVFADGEKKEGTWEAGKLT